MTQPVLRHGENSACGCRWYAGTTVSYCLKADPSYGEAKALRLPSSEAPR